MADVVTPDVRSRMMSGIRSTGTKPEMILRRGLHQAGFRYRLHARNLPGRPDLVFPRYHAVIFAHGCFWHGHDCHLFKWPSTRPEFWQTKIARNRTVDARSEAALEEQGWRIGIVWECAVKGRFREPQDRVIASCAQWLRSGQNNLEIRGAA
ncbi:very short patch repair endonuclease [Bradyrhizobium sp. 30]|uniref:very short patch repair endonuclease n=1 Tax=Bradyrhizobium sp. 30 TaxID=2782669 RepID=UPI001FF971E4|nr:very short patch repair endonuclease [Bradyrhizobium sp. 30]MCK1289378.1 DNA mismatch endonuclease Vsr [Bradyrhizobium sp. 30]